MTVDLYCSFYLISLALSASQLAYTLFVLFIIRQNKVASMQKTVMYNGRVVVSGIVAVQMFINAYNVFGFFSCANLHEKTLKSGRVELLLKIIRVVIYTLAMSTQLISVRALLRVPRDVSGAAGNDPSDSKMPRFLLILSLVRLSFFPLTFSMLYSNQYLYGLSTIFLCSFESLVLLCVILVSRGRIEGTIVAPKLGGPPDRTTTKRISHEMRLVILLTVSQVAVLIFEGAAYALFAGRFVGGASDIVFWHSRLLEMILFSIQAYSALKMHLLCGTICSGGETTARERYAFADGNDKSDDIGNDSVQYFAEPNAGAVHIGE